MKSKTLITLMAILLTGMMLTGKIYAQSDSLSRPDLSNIIVDEVHLRNGSVLSGTILRWELGRGMEFRLLTGAEIMINKSDIRKVSQRVSFAAAPEEQRTRWVRAERPYNFREKGMYHTFSAFLNVSEQGGAGLHYSIGHRFNRLLGIGLGSGMETLDFWNDRDIIPIYAEARGYFLAQKITPYYAVKIGYGIAVRKPDSGIIDATGGFHFSPELGVRFGAGDVSFYTGLEYKLQNATYVNNRWPWDSMSGTVTDKVSFRRLELRTGLTF